MANPRILFSMLFYLAFQLISIAPGDLIVYEQTRTSNSQAGNLVFNKLLLQPHETLQKVEIEYFVSNGYGLLGQNQSSSNYTVTIDLIGLFKLQPPTANISRSFSSQTFLFAPRSQIVSTYLGGFSFSGTSQANPGNPNYSQYVGLGTFNVGFDWSLAVSTNRPTFSFAVDPIGTVNTVTVRHYVQAVPEPAAWILIGSVVCVFSAFRLRS